MLTFVVTSGGGGGVPFGWADIVVATSLFSCSSDLTTSIFTVSLLIVLILEAVNVVFDDQ